MSIAGQLIESLNSKDFEQLMVLLKSSELNQLLKTAGVVDLVIVIASIFHECVDSISTAATVDGIELNQKLFIFNEALYECCRLLRNSCAVGRSIQDRIANIEPSIFSKINVILGDLTKPAILPRNTRQMCWQFVANLCVQNDLIQRKLWIECSASLFNHLNCVCDTECSRECTMILYNLLISEMLSVNDVKSIVELLLQCILDRHDLQTNDFHQLFMEYLIVNYRQIAPVYDRLTSPEKRINFIFYVAEHMKSIRHTIISTPLLQFICKEFKKKSDCVLKTIGSALDAIHPREVIALLEVIARASSDERYTHVLATDRSLFINVGCLLRTIHDIGKQQPIDANDHTNIFAPVQKLTQLAPNSSENSNIERDISYQLKSMLIRLIANLAYKNKSNQDLAREMEFIMAVLDSTALDARNPLIKEWSILAIRNLCENNMENQQIIRQLTKVGDSNSDTIKEFNLDLGSLRINPTE